VTGDGQADREYTMLLHSNIVKNKFKGDNFNDSYTRDTDT